MNDASKRGGDSNLVEVRLLCWLYINRRRRRRPRRERLTEEEETINSKRHFCVLCFFKQPLPQSPNLRDLSNFRDFGKNDELCGKKREREWLFFLYLRAVPKATSVD